MVEVAVSDQTSFECQSVRTDLVENLLDVSTWIHATAVFGLRITDDGAITTKRWYGE